MDKSSTFYRGVFLKGVCNMSFWFLGIFSVSKPLYGQLRHRLTTTT